MHALDKQCFSTSKGVAVAVVAVASLVYSCKPSIICPRGVNVGQFKGDVMSVDRSGEYVPLNANEGRGKSKDHQNHHENS
eukprot:SAG31_NODE_816_length_11865_cov_38.805116_5_plen_80_part_00